MIVQASEGPSTTRSEGFTSLSAMLLTNSTVQIHQNDVLPSSLPLPSQSNTDISSFKRYQLFRYTPSKSLRSFYLYNSPSQEAGGASSVIADVCIVIVKDRRPRTDWRLVSVGNFCGWTNVSSAAFSQNFKRIFEVFRYETLPPEMRRIGWFGGRLMLGVNLSYFVATNLMTLGVGIYYIVLAWAKLTDYRLLITFISSVLLVLTLITLWLIYFTDPGIIPANPPRCNDASTNAANLMKTSDSINSHISNYNPLKFYKYPSNFPSSISEEGNDKTRRLCTYCNIERPIKFKHCHQCNCCVIGHDHHCPLTGTCIGQRNYWYYFLFLLAINSLLVISFTVSVYLINRQPGAIPTKIKHEPGLMFVATWSGCFLFQLLYLLAFHIYLVCTGKTTYEHWKGKTHFDDELADRNKTELALSHFMPIPSLLFESSLLRGDKKLWDSLTPEEYYSYYDVEAPESTNTPPSKSSPYSSPNANRKVSEDHVSEINLELGDDCNGLNDSINLDNSVNNADEAAAVNSPIYQLSPVSSLSSSPRTNSFNI